MFKKLLAVNLAIIIAIVFFGCTRTVMVDRPIYVNIPVKCIVPNVQCEVSGNDGEVVIGLMKCIIDLKESAKVCK